MLFEGCFYHGHCDWQPVLAVFDDPGHRGVEDPGGIRVRGIQIRVHEVLRQLLTEQQLEAFADQVLENTRTCIVCGVPFGPDQPRALSVSFRDGRAVGGTFFHPACIFQPVKVQQENQGEFDYTITCLTRGWARPRAGLIVRSEASLEFQRELKTLTRELGFTVGGEELLDLGGPPTTDQFVVRFDERGVRIEVKGYLAENADGEAVRLKTGNYWETDLAPYPEWVDEAVRDGSVWVAYVGKGFKLPSERDDHRRKDRTTAVELESEAQKLAITAAIIAVGR